MKYFLLIPFTFFVLLIIQSVAYAQQHGSVSGLVKTIDGSPLAYATVALKGTTTGSSTSSKGAFHIDHVSPGTYTLLVRAVNVSTQERQIVVTAGQNTKVIFTIQMSSAELQEVTVKARHNAIKTDHPSQSLRIQEPLLLIPQNIQVVSHESIRQQQIISMSDGLIRNVSGAVRQEHWADLYTNILMRGAQVQAFRNGFNIVNSSWGPLTEDMSFVDHVEFVKGPAGFMLSNGDPSGLYNVVTKKPSGQNKAELSYTLGSFNLNRGTIDLDGKLSKDGKLLYRLNLSAQDKKSFRANEFNDRYAIAPVLSYQIGDRTKVTAEYIYQRAYMSDIGSYYIFSPSGYASLPRNFSPLPSGLPPTKINDQSISLNIHHQLNKSFNITAQGAYYAYKQDGTSMWADSVNTDGSWYRNVGIWEAKSTMLLGQLFLNGKFTTGGIVHKILAGIDLGNKKYMADYNQTHSLDTGSVPFNPHQPGLPTLNAPNNGYPVYDRTLSLKARAEAGNGISNSRYSGFYLQDELGFLEEKIRLTLAGRYTYVSQTDGGGTYDAKHFTPRIGLSVSLDDQTSVYGLYDQAFLPQTAARLLHGGRVKPITGSNLEFGIKKDWAEGKWNTTLALYRILKNNEASPLTSSTPSNPISFLLGQKRAQGIEFDIRGELFPGLDMTANYALTDSRVTKVGDDASDVKVNVGDVVPGFSKHVANAWLSYKIQEGILKDLGFSAGATYLAGRQTDTWSVGLEKLPNYFKLDGGIFWERKKVRIAANAFNVFDKYTYSGSYYSPLKAYTYQADAPRNYRLSVSYRIF